MAEIDPALGAPSPLLLCCHSLGPKRSLCDASWLKTKP